MAIQIRTPDRLAYQFYPITGGIIDFRVRASNDVNVALTEGPTETDRMYEVHIGQCNLLSSITRNRKNPAKSIINTPGILSESLAKGFWIAWIDGSIAVGREGHLHPFLSYEGSELVNVTHFGISTGCGSAGEWIVDGINTTKISTPDIIRYKYYPVTGGLIHFQVKAPHDVQIALTGGPAETIEMYEVFLGAWDNTKTVIRKNRMIPEKAVAITQGILSENEQRGFWIKWDGNNIAVGYEGQVIPFVQYDDPDPFRFTHFGICTGWGATGEWIIKGPNK